MRYSPQEWYCNNCGKRMDTPPCTAMIGGFMLGYKVCSAECSREMQWKDTLSLLGKPYRPQLEEKK
jgi:hypothetical protein